MVEVVLKNMKRIRRFRLLLLLIVIVGLGVKYENGDYF